MSAKKQSVPVFILAGGLGTRISEETHLRPKPMIEIGDIPILVHLMRWYYAHGFDDFVVLGGYRCWELKSYFLNYEFRQNHMAIDHRAAADSKPTIIPAAKPRGGSPLSSGEWKQPSELQERWRVRVIDTGVDCMTGGRVARAFDLLEAQGEKFEDFALTYGDGLSDVDLSLELEYHRKHGKLGTILGVHPMARFGELDIRDDDTVESFLEKPQSRQGLINGGFFFFKREFRKYLSDKGDCILEKAPLSNLATDRGLRVFKHQGFWQPMDTLRDKVQLQGMWDSGNAPWVAKR